MDRPDLRLTISAKRKRTVTPRTNQASTSAATCVPRDVEIPAGPRSTEATVQTTNEVEVRVELSLEVATPVPTENLEDEIPHTPESAGTPDGNEAGQ